MGAYNTSDRVSLDAARGTMLGLALGDAYGRPLEFVGLPRVRIAPVTIAPGAFQWTDDTHMALYLGRAILDLAPGVFREDAFGEAVGRRFVAWLEDPLTPSTAPGGTCLRGATAFKAEGNWRTSGVRDSDGCGAVMRIAPVGIAFHGEALTRAAEISAMVTHAHPNAVEAAIAASWMLRWTLEEGTFGRETVERAIGRLGKEWSRGGGTTAEALAAALQQARRPGLQWLDEAAIPAGDGGWRAPSALGLAVTAALVWGSDFAVAVEKAARIGGDSDSVACLAGMFLGAAGGVAVLPVAWREAIADREAIVGLAEQLVRRAGAGEALRGVPVASFQAQPLPTYAQVSGTQGALAQAFEAQAVALLHTGQVPALPIPLPTPLPPAPPPQGLETPRALSRVEKRPTLVPPGDAWAAEFPTELDIPYAARQAEAAVRTQPRAKRTSLSDPIQVAWMPQVFRGRVGVTFAPGKKCTSLSGHPWDRTLGVDLDRLSGLYRISVLVCLLEDRELVELGIHRLIDEAATRNIAVLRLPVPDGGTPSLQAVRSVVDTVNALAKAGHSVAIHCRGGLGRAGTVAACCLVAAGDTPDGAMVAVRQVRPGAIENRAQEAFVKGYARLLGGAGA